MRFKGKLKRMYGMLKGSKKMKIIFWGSSVTYGDDGWSMCEYIKETMKCDVVKYKKQRGETS